jgi:hypothetical protein
MRNVNYHEEKNSVIAAMGFFNLKILSFFFLCYRSPVMERNRLSCQFGGGIEYNYRIGVGWRGRKEW